MNNNSSFRLDTSADYKRNNFLVHGVGGVLRTDININIHTFIIIQYMQEIFMHFCITYINYKEYHLIDLF